MAPVEYVGPEDLAALAVQGPPWVTLPGLFLFYVIGRRGNKGKESQKVTFGKLVSSRRYIS